ncbi:MAG: hypothetical protein U9R58_02475 [Chloroflexota bacterium]|nr:hypothetical protein [Chloroflexota bacterium]
MGLSNNLKLTTLIAGLCLVALILIPGDPKDTLILGLSPSRLLLIVGFLLIISCLSNIIFYFRRKPEAETGLIQKFDTLLQKYLVRKAKFATPSLIIVFSLFLIYELLTTSNQYEAQLLLRLLPVILFAIGVSFQILSFRDQESERKQWLNVILLTLLFTTGSIIVQNILLGQLERPYVLDIKLLKLTQLAIALTAFIFFTWVISLESKERRTWYLLLLFLVSLSILQWTLYPKSYWRTKHLLTIFIPSGIVLTTILTMLVFDFWRRLKRKSRQKLSSILTAAAILILILLIVPYYSSAAKHSQQLNDSPSYTDQRDYLDFAVKARELDFNYAGKYNQMPLYPFFQALFYRIGMDDLAFYTQGKHVNIILSLVLLTFLFLIFKRFLPFFESSLLTLIIAFSLYIFKAPYFQAEVLYYFLAFLGFVLMCQMIIQPDTKTAIATGIVLGLAHLTKASIIPGLIIMIAVYILKELIYWIQRYKSKSTDDAHIRKSLKKLGYLLLVLICFTVVIYPYIRNAKLRFDNYFYNVNTTLYIWYDDFYQVREAEEMYNFVETWPPPGMPADEIPSASKYFSTHTFDQILDRIQFGVNAQLENIRNQFSVTNFQLTYFELLLIVLLADLKNSFWLIKKYPYVIGFSILFFLGYLALFSWYSTVSPERRFTYGLYIPFMFAIFVGINESVYNQLQVVGKGNSIDLKQFVNAANFVVVITLFINIWLTLTERMFFDRYGS